MGNHMSFTVTESELQRQKNAETTSLSLDPRGKSDAIMMTVFMATYFINLLAALFLLWNRKYPPLKSKGPILMTLMMAVSVVWFVGDLQGNGHLPLANTPLTNCKAFGFWMRILMGACTICALTAFRAYGLYRVFFLNLPYHTVGLYLPFFIYYTIMLVYGIVVQVLKYSLTTEYSASLDICNYTRPFKMSLFVFMWLSWVAMMGVFWKIRNIKSSFNEGREMMVTCGIIFVLLVAATTINFTRPSYPLHLSLRMLTTILNHLATTILWWLIMAVPMYNCMFNRQEYLSRWILKLRKDGLQNEYDDEPSAYSGHRHVLSASYNVRNNMLYLDTGGKGDSKGFQQIGDGCYQSKDNVSQSGSCGKFTQPFENTFYNNSDTAYNQNYRSLGAIEQRLENVIMEARPESPIFNASNRI